MIMKIKLTETIRQTVTGVLRLSISKQRQLRILLTLFVVIMARTLIANEYSSDPAIKTFTEIETDETTPGPKIDYSGELFRLV